MLGLLRLAPYKERWWGYPLEDVHSSLSRYQKDSDQATVIASGVDLVASLQSFATASRVNISDFDGKFNDVILYYTTVLQ